MDIRVRGVPPEVHKTLKMIAVEKETSVNQIMLELIAQFVLHEGSKK